MTQSLSLKPNSLEIRKNASLRMFTENLRTLIPLVLTGIHIRLQQTSRNQIYRGSPIHQRVE